MQLFRYGSLSQKSNQTFASDSSKCLSRLYSIKSIYDMNMLQC